MGRVRGKMLPELITSRKGNTLRLASFTAAERDLASVRICGGAAGNFPARDHCRRPPEGGERSEVRQ